MGETKTDERDTSLMSRQNIKARVIEIYSNDKTRLYGANLECTKLVKALGNEEDWAFEELLEFFTAIQEQGISVRKSRTFKPLRHKAIKVCRDIKQLEKLIPFILLNEYGLLLNTAYRVCKSKEELFEVFEKYFLPKVLERKN